MFVVVVFIVGTLLAGLTFSGGGVAWVVGGGADLGDTAGGADLGDTAGGADLGDKLLSLDFLFMKIDFFISSFFTRSSSEITLSASLSNLYKWIK